MARILCATQALPSSHWARILHYCVWRPFCTFRSKNALDLLREVGKPSPEPLHSPADTASPGGDGSPRPHFVLLSAVCVKNPKLELQRAKRGNERTSCKCYKYDNSNFTSSSYRGPSFLFHLAPLLLLLWLSLSGTWHVHTNKQKAMERALRNQRRPPRPTLAAPCEATPLLEPDPQGIPGVSRRPIPPHVASLRPVDYSIVRPTAFFKSLAGQV